MSLSGFHLRRRFGPNPPVGHAASGSIRDKPHVFGDSEGAYRGLRQLCDAVPVAGVSLIA